MTHARAPVRLRSRSASATSCWGYVYLETVRQMWAGTMAEVPSDPMDPIILYYALGTLLAVPLIAYGILRTHLFDIDLRIRWTIKQSTLAAAVVTIIYVLSEGASRLLSSELGSVAGLVAAGLVVFFLAPLQRFAERVASNAMPNTHNTPEYAAHRKLQVYESAIAEACRAAAYRKKNGRCSTGCGTRSASRRSTPTRWSATCSGKRSRRPEVAAASAQSRVFFRHADPCAVSDAWSMKRACPPRAGGRSTRACCTSACSCARTTSPGRRWSATQLPGRLHLLRLAVPHAHAVADLRARSSASCAAHVRRFARALEFDLAGRELAMTDCWVNIMPRRVAHSLHLHPLSTISGTYYVRTPRGAAGPEVRGSAPRPLHGRAAAPARLPRRVNRPGSPCPPTAGKLVLFESWLRHEVPPNPVAAERISISFNYDWF